ncbi:MAG TPA: hypothetical protein VLD59_08185 [Steroidobacteraceae bacterium]|nr:hypothetical protein [Steroidobacteraceae bacterium]
MNSPGLTVSTITRFGRTEEHYVFAENNFVRQPGSDEFHDAMDDERAARQSNACRCDNSSMGGSCPGPDFCPMCQDDNDDTRNVLVRVNREASERRFIADDAPAADLTAYSRIKAVLYFDSLTRDDSDSNPAEPMQELTAEEAEAMDDTSDWAAAQPKEQS